MSQSSEPATPSWSIEGSVLDPREGALPVGAAVAGVSLVSSARMSLVFKTKLKNRIPAVSVGVISSFLVGSAAWHFFFRRRRLVLGDRFSATCNWRRDALERAKGGEIAFLSSIFAGYCGGMAVGKDLPNMIKSTEVFSMVGPVTRKFIFSPIGLLVMGGVACFAIQGAQRYTDRHAALEQQQLQESRKVFQSKQAAL